MKVDLVTRQDDLATFAERWDALALEDPRDGFFRTSRWYLSWMRNIRPDAQPFVIVVRDSAGAIVGIAPLCQVSYRDLGFRLRGVSFAGREVVSGDFLDFVATSGTKAVVTSAVLEYLWARRKQWSLLITGELLEGSDSYHALESFGRQNGLSMRRQEARICPYIALPGSFDEYLATLGSSTRYHIRRRMRDVEKNGGLIEIFSRPDEVAGHLDTLIRLHLARWRADGLPGTLGRPGFAAFLREVCLDLPQGAGCRLCVLNHKDQAAAALLTFSFGNSTLYYQAGWDPTSALASLSPAVVLMAQSIRDAIARGSTYYEFLRGDEAYKSRWTKTYRTTATLLIARSFMAREQQRVAWLKDRVKRFLPGKQVAEDSPPVQAVSPAEASSTAILRER